MSREYDLYLQQHRDNVRKGYEWIKLYLPQLLGGLDLNELDRQIINKHDASKDLPVEYFAYDAYFYGNNRSYQVVTEFNYAWLHHIHRNHHHWQYWILHNDDPGEGMVIIEMPYNYIIEMICDWWAFSHAKGNLFEIFNWYDEHKDYMKLGEKTRDIVNDILHEIRKELEKDEDSN